MATDRRTLLKGITATAAMSIVSMPSRAADQPKAPPADAVGLMYDATKCIGCKTCVVACREANHLDADTHGYGKGLYDAPDGLNEYTKNVIQLYREGNEYSYVKKQCMHCVDPACVNACMLGALSKGKYGIVSWEAGRCVGCRYCEVACAFGVPQFEYSKANPRIVKCELCRDRLDEGKQPACTEVCPRNAVIFGKRADLLKEAHRRLAANPSLYVQKVYGETDLGGTQVLYLSHVPFEKLGFRFSDPRPVASVQHLAQRQVYAPLALYALVGGLMFRARRKAQVEAAEADQKDKD